MTPEQWETIKELVALGLKREGDLRARCLEEACAGDPVVRAEVEELIASHEQAGSFMASPCDAATRLVADDREASLVGQRIGPYRNVRELGQGGMGTVYLAVRDDEAYRKEVAVKVVKRGMDTEAIVRAFRIERQILATLDHPNIARLLDGGAIDDGRPYFVMDYVEGVPLDVYCDTHRLPILDRVKLFRIVCSAVHYAHQHGVIHRDPKPGNILVTPDGVPKLVDFGIAKVLNPALSSLTTGSTTTVRPLTPAYASPEQIRGEAITPASDVYSLGVVLYELLTGHRPYRLEGQTPQELERVICEQEPERPSTVVTHTESSPLAGPRRRRLARDLDTIVLIALHKDPSRRYASVGQLSEDIQRYLDNLPITARPDTLAYRTGKFVSRNQASVSTAAISSALMLLLGVVGMHPFASRQQTLAVLPFEPLVANAQDEYLEVGLADALIAKLGSLSQLKVRPTQQVLKYRGAGRDLKAAARELGVEALLVGSMQRDGERLRLSLELVAARDGSVQWTQKFDEPWADVFAVEDAIATHVADALTVRLTGAERERVARRDTENSAAYQEYLLGRHYWTQFTASQLKQALEHFQRAVELDPRYAPAYAGIADAYASFGAYRVLPPNEAYARSRVAATEAIELNPALSQAYSTLALVTFYYDWDWPVAERHFTRAIQLDPDNAEAHNRYALVLMLFERFEEAIRESTRARELDPLSVRINVTVGLVLYWARRYEESIQELTRALALDPNFFQTHQFLGWCYVQKGMYEQAIAEFKKAIDLGAGTQVDSDLAHAYAVSGRTHEANVLLRQMIENTGRRYVSSADIAIVYAGLGDRDQTFAWLDKAYDEHTRPMLTLKINPRFDGLRSDPRFTSLTRRVKIFEAAPVTSEAILPSKPGGVSR